MATVESAREPRRERTALRIVDCDVHNALPSKDAIKEYLPAELQAAYEAHPKGGNSGINMGARPHHGIFRDDSFPASGGLPGSSLELMQEQLLDRWDIARAILSPLENLEWVQYGELGAALARGLNEYLREHWLDQDDRLYAAVTVPTDDGVAAAAEIRRIASTDPRFVQVLLLVGTMGPLGHPKYWPIYDAAAECGLPVAVHVGGFSGTTSSVGSVTYQVARHTVHPAAYQAQMISLLASGILDRLPEIQFVFEEGGFTWVPSLMWRLDRSSAAFGAHGPRFGKSPSDLIREHFYFTTQPIDEPERPEYLTQTIDQMGMADRIMFATDYPHWDFDPPDRVLRSEVDREVRERIFAGNAERLYSFPQ